MEWHKQPIFLKVQKCMTPTWLVFNSLPIPQFLALSRDMFSKFSDVDIYPHQLN